MKTVMRINFGRLLLGAVTCLALSAAIGVGSPSASADDSALPPKTVNLTLEGASVRTALVNLFNGTGINYVLDQSVTGFVTVALKNVSFESALHALLKSSSVPLTSHVEDGVYYIKAKSDDVSGSTGTPAPVQTAPTPVTQPATSPGFNPPIPQGFAPTPDTGTGGGGDTGGLLQQYEVIQLKYANPGLLLKVFGQPSLDIPSTTLQGMGTGGGGGGGGGFGANNNGGGNTNNLGGNNFGNGGNTNGFGGNTNGFGGNTNGFGGNTTFGGGNNNGPRMFMSQ